MTITVKREFKFTFSTLILERQLEGVDELNRRLSEKILSRAERDPGVSRSNVGGWHSATDFLRWEGPEPGELFQRVLGAVQDYVAIERKVDAKALELSVTVDAWANVARAGHYAKPHVHPNANLSGVYYVSVGDAPPDDKHSGVIEFLDPRQRPNMFETEGTLRHDVYRVTPQAGLLLLFPAWLQHYVNPYHGSAPRVCVAFNASIQKLRVLTPP